MTLEKNKIVEVFRFGIVGVIATSVHYGLYYFLQKKMNVNMAYSLAYLASFFMNFYLTSFFTFKVKPSFRKLFGLAGAHFINYILQLLLLNLFLYLSVSKEIAPLPVFALVIPINFVLVRYVFKKNNQI